MHGNILGLSAYKPLEENYTFRDSEHPRLVNPTSPRLLTDFELRMALNIFNQ